MDRFVEIVSGALDDCAYRDQISFVAEVSIADDDGLENRRLIVVRNGVASEEAACAVVDIRIEYMVVDGAMRLVGADGAPGFLLSYWLLELSQGWPDPVEFAREFRGGGRDGARAD